MYDLEWLNMCMDEQRMNGTIGQVESNGYEQMFDMTVRGRNNMDEIKARHWDTEFIETAMKRK
jgi:hypothetical protein